MFRALYITASIIRVLSGLSKVCIAVSMCMHTHTHLHIYIYICIYIYMCMYYMYMHANMYVYLYTLKEVMHLLIEKVHVWPACVLKHFCITHSSRSLCSWYLEHFQAS